MPHAPTPLSDPKFVALAARIWRRDPAVFVGAGAPDSVHAAIRTRLGWLDAPAAAAGHLDDLTRFAADIRADGLTHVILLGMGGSSLCAEVLRDVPDPNRGPNGCRMDVLDTTDERAVRTITESLDASRALFLVASKSGLTLEVTALEQHFWAVVERAVGPGAAGRHFAAITDPGTPLEASAAQRGYRRTFLNPPDIGGRYSALSLFGLVPAALLGCDLAALTSTSMWMADACRAEGAQNPGLALGAFMSSQAQAGRDKLTVLLPPEMRAFGAWIEQLVAESTGKLGQGVLPVVGEPIGAVREYGNDRAFVAITSQASDDVGRIARQLEGAGHPVLRIETSPGSLGGEFFRWEFATAAAGALLGLNPFDEPNVREAKTRTLAQLDARKHTGVFRIEPPFTRGEGYSRREFHPEDAPPTTRRRYVALLDFLPADSAPVETVRQPPRRAALAPRPRDDARRRPALPALDRPVPQGRPQHGHLRAADGRRRQRHARAWHGLHLQRAETSAGARRLRRARRQRPRRRALSRGRSDGGLLRDTPAATIPGSASAFSRTRLASRVLRSPSSAAAAARSSRDALVCAGAIRQQIKLRQRHPVGLIPGLKERNLEQRPGGHPRGQQQRRAHTDLRNHNPIPQARPNPPGRGFGCSTNRTEQVGFRGGPNGSQPDAHADGQYRSGR